MERYALHERERKLLYVLNSVNGIMTCDELAKALGVSKRTVRNDISSINTILQTCGGRILSIYGKGYALQFPDRAAFHELMSDVWNIQTREDRVCYLMRSMILSGDVLDLEDMEEKMYISHSTLEKDIKKIREAYSEQFPFIRVEREGSRIWLEDDEIKKREVLIRLYMNNWDYNSEEGIILKNIFDRELVRQISETFSGYVKKYHLYMEDYQNVTVRAALMIIYQRIVDGNELVGAALHVTNERYMKIADELAGELSEEWELEVNRCEKTWLACVLEQNQSYNAQFRREPMEGVRSLPDGDLLVAEQILGRVEQQYGIDFRLDVHFKKDFALMVNRLNKPVASMCPFKSVYLEEMKTEYPYMEKIAVFICNLLEELLGKVVDQKEQEGYLLPILIISYKHLCRKIYGKTSAALVSNLNYSLSHYLYERLLDLYGSRITITGPFPAHEMEKACQSDLVISTVLQSHNLEESARFIVISPLLKREDKERIDNMIERRERHYQRN